MKESTDTEFLLVDTTGVNKKAITAGLVWLANNGGGCIVTPSKKTMMNALGARTDSEFKKAESRLGGYGITLRWKRRGMPYRAKNIMALYMDKGIDLAIQHGVFEKILFIPWLESESQWFKDAFRPTIVEVADDGGLVAVEHQPEYESARGFIPEEQDKKLEILARIASGYDNSLQWRERERFKADLMNYRDAWMQVDPKLVLRRCTELGMSAEDADEVSNMVKKLREGHMFRPKRGYEDGWRH